MLKAADMQKNTKSQNILTQIQPATTCQKNSDLTEKFNPLW